MLCRINQRSRIKTSTFPVEPAHFVVSTAQELTTALSIVMPGQSIQVNDGVYTGKFKIMNKSATASQPILVYGTKNAVIDAGSVSTGYGFHIDTCRNVTLRGITIRGGQKSIVLDSTHFSKIDSVTAHDCDAESILVRNLSCDNTIQNSTVYNTGLVSPQYGEGIYVGIYYGGWSGSSSRTGGAPDASDRTQIIGNTIYNTSAESIDIKEGTSGGLIQGNSLDGANMSGQNYADSWIDIAGCGYVVRDNIGTTALVDGIQTHTQPGDVSTASDNVFIANRLTVNGPGYGINIDTKGTGNIVYASNVVISAAKGLANVGVTPV